MKWIPKFRFSLRTIMILITLICVALTPVGMRINQGYKQQQAVAWVLENGGSVEYQYRYHEIKYGNREGTWVQLPTSIYSTPKWLRDIFGNNFFETVIAVSLSPDYRTDKIILNQPFDPSGNVQINTENSPSIFFHKKHSSAIALQVTDINILAQFSSLEMVNLTGTQITDLSPLAKHQNLRVLYLGETPISDLAPLARLEKIEYLFLNDTRIANISLLSEFKELRCVDISGTQVTDLRPLNGLTKLTILGFSETDVSDLTPLSDIESLQVLEFSDSKVTDLSPIMGNKHLKLLVLANTKVSKQDLLDIRAKIDAP
ncbi:MAG: hypothetical protein COA78_18855 [Blastopirellula sp.]|nr:MAG: hypothetical protein COA78_18855 [Blastopirellula sp.]